MKSGVSAEVKIDENYIKTDEKKEKSGGTESWEEIQSPKSEANGDKKDDSLIDVDVKKLGDKENSPQAKNEVLTSKTEHKKDDAADEDEGFGNFDDNDGGAYNFDNKNNEKKDDDEDNNGFGNFDNADEK